MERLARARGMALKKDNQYQALVARPTRSARAGWCMREAKGPRIAPRLALILS